jgi:hypothetical protein
MRRASMHHNLYDHSSDQILTLKANQIDWQLATFTVLRPEEPPQQTYSYPCVSIYLETHLFVQEFPAPLFGGKLRFSNWGQD